MFVLIMQSALESLRQRREAERSKAIEHVAATKAGKLVRSSAAARADAHAKAAQAGGLARSAVADGANARVAASNAANLMRSAASRCATAPKAEGFLKDNAGKIAIATCAVTAGAVAGVLLTQLVRRLNPHVRIRTKYGPAFVLTGPTEHGDDLRSLVVGNVYQSATYLGTRWNELPFEYYRAFDRMFDAGIPIQSTLLLGGGGFAYPKHLLTKHDDVAMDVVESDPKIVELALDHFYLDKLMDTCGDRLNVNISEGLAYLQTTERTYDAIINDAFRGARPDDDLDTIEATRLVKARLNPGGLYLVNVVAYPSSNQGYAHLEELTAQLEQVFDHVWILPSTDEEFSEEENYLVIASDGDYSYPDAILR